MFSVDRTHRDLSTLNITDLYLFTATKYKASNLPEKQKKRAELI